MVSARYFSLKCTLWIFSFGRCTGSRWTWTSLGLIDWLLVLVKKMPHLCSCLMSYFCELVWKGIKSGLKIYVPDPKENTLLEAKGQSRSYIWQALRQTNKKNTSCAFNTAYWQKQNSPLSNNKENYLAFQNTHVLKSLWFQSLAQKHGVTVWEEQNKYSEKLLAELLLSGKPRLFQTNLYHIILTFCLLFESSLNKNTD